MAGQLKHTFLPPSIYTFFKGFHLGNQTGFSQMSFSSVGFQIGYFSNVSQWVTLGSDQFVTGRYKINYLSYRVVIGQYLVWFYPAQIGFGSFEPEPFACFYRPSQITD